MDNLFYYIANTKVSEIRTEFVKSLITKGADINWKTLYGENALHIATIRKVSVDIIKLLVEKGLDVNSAKDLKQK